MRMDASHQTHVQTTPGLDVVHILGQSLNQTGILPPLDRLADELGGLDGFDHDSGPPVGCGGRSRAHLNQDPRRMRLGEAPYLQL